MEHVHTALTFSEWALEFIVVPPFCIAFILAATSFVLAAVKQRPFKTRLWKPHYWLVVTHVMFFAAAIAVGVLWANPITNPTVPHHADPFAVRYLDAVTYGSLVSCGFWIWRMKGFRWYATSLMAMGELVTCGALLVAGMSIAGDWI
jgi:hypothetical protein